MRCEEKFSEIYGKENTSLAFCPYRICPVGAHSDHQHGKITGLAIDKGIYIAYSPVQNGDIEMNSLNFENKAKWNISEIPKYKVNDWADYLRGATIALGNRHSIETGLYGVIEGSMPIGGLSSSAAVTIAFISALADVNGIKLVENEIIEIALNAETEYVEVSCGKLDQSCEVYSKKNHLLYLDTLDDSYEIIPQNPIMKPYKIAVFFSGIERKLAGSKYNVRVDECRSAAYALKAFSGMEYTDIKNTYLRDVPVKIFHEYKNRLPESWAKRAEHFYSEFERVTAAAEAWKSGDIEAFGRLSFESGRSSIENYETGSEYLIRLQEIMLKTDGIYGGRFSGAGMNGCSMALYDPAFEESIIKNVSNEYIKAFPLLKDKFSTHICVSADGIKL